LSSTTSPDRSAPTSERGQVLVLFAGGVLALLVVAALAFDVGMMLLERRDQQDAADAAALAGARFIFEPDCNAGTGWACTKARAAATAVALANGFDDASPVQQVIVHIPAVHGRYDLLPSFVEVEIGSQRPSIFAGVLGKAQWPVGTFAVATNDNHLEFPFSTLALNPTMCKAIMVSGQGELEAFGNIQSNSNGSEAGCGGIGMSRTGGGEINIIADDATCRSAGAIQNQGSGTMTCSQAPGSFALPDPLGDLSAPTKPALAAPLQKIGHTKAIEPRCPGASPPPVETQANGCDLAGNGGGSRGTAWLLSPGLYPAGLTIDNEARAYLLPGIYWIGGGGLAVNGDASLVTVDSLATATSLNGMPVTTPACWAPTGNCKTLWNSNGGGVLFYNSKLPTKAGGPIDIGGGGGVLFVKALFDPVSTPPDPNEIYNNMSVFQDRTVTSTVVFNGSNADAEVAGIVYVPAGGVQVNGSSSAFTMDQVIADWFKVNGSTGTIHVLKRVGVDAIVTAAGLVD
jgi:hypothetical protein